MKIRFGQIELARGLTRRESPMQFALATARETQIAPALRAAQAEVFDRGNLRTVVTFAISKRHENQEQALRFAAAHPLALANQTGGLTFILEDAASEAELYLPDAAIRSLRCAPAGIITNTEYEFIGSAITRTPPPSA
jgi:hypothetical protein